MYFLFKVSPHIHLEGFVIYLVDVDMYMVNSGKKSANLHISSLITVFIFISLDMM